MKFQWRKQENWQELSLVRVTLVQPCVSSKTFNSKCICPKHFRTFHRPSSGVVCMCKDCFVFFKELGTISVNSSTDPNLKLFRQNVSLLFNKIYTHYIYAPPWGLSTLAKEFSAAAHKMQSSSKELSTHVADRV